MNASVTNQIIPKHSLDTLTTISKMKYFGHKMQSSDSMKKYAIRTDSLQWKIRKTAYRMITEL